MNKQIMIDGVDVADCEHINACDKKMKCVILQDDVCEINPYCEGFNCYYKQLKRKEQECERLKEKLNPKLKNAHCTYFEGQTGLCKAKEFSRCNPVGCKLYTIDELSTIVDLQQQLDQLKAQLLDQEKSWHKTSDEISKVNSEYTAKLKQTLNDIKEIVYLLNDRTMVRKDICDRLDLIQQKISECDVNNER